LVSTMKGVGRKEPFTILSKKFTDYETRYMVNEKTCCALTWAYATTC